MRTHTPPAQLSINSSRASTCIVPSLIKIAAQNEEMAMASCNKRAGTHSGTTVAAPGGEWQKQDVEFVVAVAVAWRVFCLPCHRFGDLFKKNKSCLLEASFCIFTFKWWWWRSPSEIILALPGLLRIDGSECLPSWHRDGHSTSAGLCSTGTCSRLSGQV